MTTSEIAVQQLEIHVHSYIRGPLANRGRQSELKHAHHGGFVRHEHLDTGPACFTVDKDDWYRDTGLRGGGRKTFVRRPTGPQLAFGPVSVNDAPLRGRRPTGREQTKGLTRVTT